MPLDPQAQVFLKERAAARARAAISPRWSRRWRAADFAWSAALALEFLQQ